MQKAMCWPALFGMPFLQARLQAQTATESISGAVTDFTEALNAFNVGNLTGYSAFLDKINANPPKQTFASGQPTQRNPQSFLSGCPRALQFGARIIF
jgi:hypothetical protein